MAGPWGPRGRMPLPPLRPGDIHLSLRDNLWGHRYYSPHGLQRWYAEMGPPCQCPCQRALAPGEGTAHPDEHPAARVPIGVRLDRLRRARMKQCPCQECGVWEEGPLRPGEVRGYWGCTNVIMEWMHFCHGCPPFDVHEPGLPPPKRVRLGA